ncbi:hypothetical protein CDD83_9533 [Cordyceps sp. RAO-2017]|nr:hypothetical protein CDD83_9533 [Cordyceps sp. RAO-2017]
MRLRAFTLVALTCSAWALDADLLRKKYTDSLQKQARIDWSNPPKYELKVTERTCMPFWSFYSIWTDFLTRQTLLRPSDGTNVSITVGCDIIPQLRFLNLNNKDTPIQAEEGTWITDGITEGWNAGAALNAKVVTVSGGYDRHWHKSTMKVKSLGISESCPPYHECRFETWSYNINYVGQCQREAIIHAFTELNICDQLSRLDDLPFGLWVATRHTTDQPSFEERLEACPQFTNWGRKQCQDPDGPQYGTKPQGECKLQLPIMDGASGERLYTLVFVKENYGSEDVADAPTNAEAPIATRADDVHHCVFMLNTGQWYDSVSGGYFDKSTEDWESKPDAPTPIIPDELRPSDCPSSTDKTGGDRRRGSMSSNIKVAKKGIHASKTLGKRDSPQRRKGKVEIKVVAGFQGF